MSKLVLFFVLAVVVSVTNVGALSASMALRKLKTVQEAESRVAESILTKLQARRLQDGEAPNVPPEFEPCLQIACPNPEEICDQLIECIVDATNSIFLPCLSSFGTMGTVYRCYIGLTSEGDDTSTSAQLSSGNFTLSDDADAGFGAVTPNPSEVQCTTFFRDGNEFSYASVACLTKLQSAQSLEDFFVAAANNFAGVQACSSLASLFGETGGSEDSAGESGEIAEAVEPLLDDINSFVDECDQHTGIKTDIENAINGSKMLEPTLLLLSALLLTIFAF